MFLSDEALLASRLNQNRKTAIGQHPLTSRNLYLLFQLSFRVSPEDDLQFFPRMKMWYHELVWLLTAPLGGFRSGLLLTFHGKWESLSLSLSLWFRVNAWHSKVKDVLVRRNGFAKPGDPARRHRKWSLLFPVYAVVWEVVTCLKSTYPRASETYPWRDREVSIISRFLESQDEAQSVMVCCCQPKVRSWCLSEPLCCLGNLMMV